MKVKTIKGTKIRKRKYTYRTVYFMPGVDEEFCWRWDNESRKKIPLVRMNLDGDLMVKVRKLNVPPADY
jgi:hypothetical protein